MNKCWDSERQEPFGKGLNLFNIWTSYLVNDLLNDVSTKCLWEPNGGNTVLIIYASLYGRILV